MLSECLQTARCTLTEFFLRIVQEAGFEKYLGSSDGSIFERFDARTWEILARSFSESSSSNCLWIVARAASEQLLTDSSAKRALILSANWLISRRTCSVFKSCCSPADRSPVTMLGPVTLGKRPA